MLLLLVLMSEFQRFLLLLYHLSHQIKVECCINYVKSIFPHIEIEAIEEALSFKNLERLLSDNPSYVIDCIDNIDSKTDLVEYCVKNNIKIISACGAGMKADPTRLQIVDISESSCKTNRYLTTKHSFSNR